jgi:O-antigen/teichoic acid export membrane protein
VLLVAVAPDLLRIWLGAEFARLSTHSLQLLAVGVTVNALAMVPFWLLQGLGRPDVCAKFHLAELVLYVPMLFVFLAWWGITGAAAAWAVRVTLDAALLAIAVARLVGAAEETARMRRLWAFGALLVLALAAACASAALGIGVATRLGVAALLSVVTGALGWIMLLEAGERATIRAVVTERLRPRGA